MRLRGPPRPLFLIFPLAFGFRGLSTTAWARPRLRGGQRNGSGLADCIERLTEGELSLLRGIVQSTIFPVGSRVSGECARPSVRNLEKGRSR